MSTGDWFMLHAGEPGDAEMEGLEDLDGYKFRLMLLPTSDLISVDIVLA